MDKLDRAILLIVFVAIGILVALTASSMLDHAAWRANQQIDGAGNMYIDDYHWEKYKVQAVEAHVIGMGIGLAVEIGLVAWWINIPRRHLK